jgi:hypothetical protein
MASRSKYVPLAHFFRSQPPDVTRVTLTLGEVEAIIGAPLPRSAYTQGRGWWSNLHYRSHTWAWRSLGWRVLSVERQPGGIGQWTATFTRAASARDAQG